MKESYITTAIPYVNGNPHLGHAMDYLLADTLRRYMMSQGQKVRFQAGTDEHGNKIFKKAAEAGISTQEFTDQNSKKFQDFIASLGVEYTDFIRTTNPDHERRCQEIWRRLKDHIYKDSYEGWYCEGCEAFVTDKEDDEAMNKKLLLIVGDMEFLYQASVTEGENPFVKIISLPLLDL